MKKLLAMLLSVATILSLGVVSLAEDPESKAIDYAFVDFEHDDITTVTPGVE